MVAPYANASAGTTSTGDIMPVTNALERINEEFRRRTKTQASLPGQDAVIFLLFGLLRSGQVRLRALVGYQDMEAKAA
jgi:transposase-like protein